VRTATLAVLAGVLLALQLSGLPDARWVLLAPPALVAAALCRRCRAPVLLAVGFLWAVLRAYLALAGALPPELEGQDVTVEGTVASVPERDGEVLRFDLEVEATAGPAPGWRLPARVRLQAYGVPPPLAVGERWRLGARLKRPRGLSNPGGRDHEAWLLLHRIRATGYLRPGPTDARLSAPLGQRVTRLRADLAQRIEDSLGDHPQRGVIKGLTVGLTGEITDRQWQVFRATGTTHLMAISGSHVVLVAGLVLGLARWGWGAAGWLPLYLPAQRAAALASVAAAWAYAALAGLAVPTQRAAVMATAMVLARAWRGTLAPTHGLALGLLAVLVLDPLSPLSPGFWLSFVAVGVLFVATGPRAPRRGLLARWGRVHLAVALGLAPLTLGIFGETPVIGALANALAVPWIGVVVVPLALAGTLLLPLWPAGGAILVGAAANAMGILWPLLEWAGGLGWSLQTGADPGVVALAAGSAGALLLLLPRGVPGRWVGLVWLTPLLAAPLPGRPAPGEAWVTVLDVGQGLAALVETAGHRLLYDAGPRYRQGRDAGENAVLPFLRSRGIARLDTLVLSHGDEDHTGGAVSVLLEVPAHRVIAGDNLPAVPAQACRDGARWDWDGVALTLRRAGGPAGPGGNNGSCVLRLVTAGGALLLAGDLEAHGERALLQGTEGDLRADVLVVPHHGSRSSSSPAFVAAVAPRHALFATGYRNRFRFPAPEVVERYRLAGTQVHDTARAGAITVRLGGPEGLSVSHYRQTHRRFWHTALE